MTSSKDRHPNIEAAINKWLHNNSLDNMSVDFEVYGRNIYLYSDKQEFVEIDDDKIEELKNDLNNINIKKKIHVVKLGEGNDIHEIRIKRKWL